MRVAVLTETSTAAKNADILAALENRPHEIVNLGMTGKAEETELTYIHTSFMSAFLINTGLIDMVVGGCGTGQGFLNAVLKYPGVTAGLLQDPLDAWLFSQINAGNCISLALNKGYGWGSDLMLGYLFDKLFQDEAGAGYPPHRSESQKASRLMLEKIDNATHLSFIEALGRLERSILDTAFSHAVFRAYVAEELPEGACRQFLFEAGYIR